MDVSLHADRAYTGDTEGHGVIVNFDVSTVVAGRAAFVYLRAVLELVLSLSFSVLQFSSSLVLKFNVFDGDPAHYREPAQFRNAVI